MGEHSSSPKTQYDLLQENERAIRDATRNRQKAKADSDAVTALHQHAQEVQRANPHLLPGAYPAIHDRMSPQDIAAAHVRMNEMGGMSPTDARDPALIGSQIRRNTGTDAQGRPFPAPAGTPEGAVPLPPARSTPAATPSSSLPPYSLPTNPDDRALLATTNARDQAAAAAARAPAPVSIPAGDPGARAFFGKPSTPEPGAAVPGALPLPPVAVPATPADPATAAAAGKGTVVQTPYGSGSSRYVPKGTAESPAVVSDTGVQRQPAETWQQAILRKYPKVGIEGSPENKAFVENFKQMQATAGGDFNPELDSHRIAGRLFDNDPVFRAKQDAKSTPAQADLNRVPQAPATAPVATPAATPTPPAAPIPVQGSNPGELFASAAARVAQKAQAVGYQNPGQFITDMIRSPAAPAAAPISSVADLRMQDAKPNPPYNLTSGAATPPVTTPPASVSGAPASLPVPAAATAAPPQGIPNPSVPVPASIRSSDADFLRSSLPGMPKQASLSPPGPWHPDDDTAAFSANPQDDEFMKKKREAQQLSYTA